MEYLGFDDNKSTNTNYVEIGMFLLTVSMILYTLGVMFLFRRSLILMSNVYCIKIYSCYSFWVCTFLLG